MISTRQLLTAIQEANPEAPLSEERLRRAIRNGSIAPPARVGDRFIWSVDEARAVAEAFHLALPRFVREVRR